MDYQKALIILNLSSNFTEEELKKNYRKLSHENHPDKWEGTSFYETAVVKQQEINEAKDYLYKYLKNNTNLNASQFNKCEYADNKLKYLKNLITINKNDIEEEELKEIIDKIENEIYSLETDVYAYYTSTKEEIDRLYQSCITSIRNMLKRYVISFYQKNYIDGSMVKEEINYNCNIIDFYNQLLKIKEKYSKEVQVKKILEVEIEQYKKYAGYNKKLENLINIIKNNTLSYLKQNNFENIAKEIIKMHQNIKKDIIEVYYALISKIIQLEIIVNKIQDESIKKQYYNICTNFETETNLNNIELSIIKLEKQIFNYQEIESKKQKQKEIEEEINKIYQSLISKYSESLKKYNIITEHAKIKKLNELLNKILKIFMKGNEEFKGLDFFKSFNNITFTTEDIDEEIIKNAIKQLNQERNVSTNEQQDFEDNNHQERNSKKRR